MTDTHITYSQACIQRGAAGLQPHPPPNLNLKKIVDTMMSLVSRSLPAIEVG